MVGVEKETADQSHCLGTSKDGRVKLTGCYSEKTGRTYDAVVVLEDTGGKYVNFKMEFEGGKGS